MSCSGLLGRPRQCFPSMNFSRNLAYPEGSKFLKTSRTPNPGPKSKKLTAISNFPSCNTTLLLIGNLSKRPLNPKAKSFFMGLRSWASLKTKLRCSTHLELEGFSRTIQGLISSMKVGVRFRDYTEFQMIVRLQFTCFRICRSGFMGCPSMQLGIFHNARV